MNRRRGWTLLALGLVLAIGTGVATFFLLQQQRQAAAAQAEAAARAIQQAPPVATLKLPVAARPLSVGTALAPEDVLLKEFPLDLVPISAITDTETLDSRILAEPVGQGETFSTGQFVGEAAGRMSQQLEPGHILFAYPINDLLTQSNVVADGDRLDLLLTMPVLAEDVASSGPVTSFTVQNIQVLKVLRAPGDDGAEAGPPVALLLSLKPEDALLVKHIKDSEGTLDFVLRSILDTEPVDVPPVKRLELLDRYQMR